MATLRLGSPIWLAGRQIEALHPSLAGSTSAEVVIVGGGITGCAAALMFAEAGVDTVLLEATGIGLGSTAASTALLMQEPDLDFRELATRYGADTARRVWNASRRATRDLIDTLERLRIACDLRECDSVYYAATEEHARALRREHRARIRAGVGGVWLEPADLEALVGFRANGAIRTTGNAQMDPYRACAGFARAASARGVRIYERSRVTRIAPARPHVDVFTSRGRVRAARVVIATGYATRQLTSLHARFRLYTTYVIATPKLPRQTRAAMGSRAVMMWDTRRPYHYVRWTTDGRLLAGGDDERRLPDRARRRLVKWHAGRLHRHLASLYPSLQGVPPQYAWEGLFATTPDGLPYIGPHRPYPRHLFALGYGGNGMTLGFLAARLLVGQHKGEREGDRDLFAFSRGAVHA